MDFDPKVIVDWLNQFIVFLQNPALLIFFCSWIIGAVIKNTQIPIPTWLIPAILSALGFLCGWTFLFASQSFSPFFATGCAGHFQAAVFGLTLALASTGAHQLFYQLKNRGTVPPTPIDPPKDAK